MARSELLTKVRIAAACVAGAAAASGCGGLEGDSPEDRSARDVPVADRSPAAVAGLRYARVRIDGMTAGERETLKGIEGIERWIEVDKGLLVLASPAVLASLKTSYAVTVLDVSPHPENLCLVHGRHAHSETLEGGSILARAASLSVFQADVSGGCEQLLSKLGPGSVRHLMGNEVVARQLVSDTLAAGTDQNPHTRDVVGALDMNRWLTDVATLASFDRYALRVSNIGQAKEWIAGEFCAIAQASLAPDPAGGGIRCQNGDRSVRTEAFPLSTVGGKNVILTLGGFVTDGPVFVVGGHYDAIANEAGSTQAPGAEDNASGAAALIEMAKAISQYPTDATFVFVAFSGEEQGLFGSTYHVQQLAGTALASRIRDVFIMDMIGYSGDAELDCMLETKDTPANQALLSHLMNMAAVYAPGIVLSSTTNFFGSDHVPFLNGGYSGLLTIENDYETYPFYHSKNDTIANQNARFQPMASLIVRMNTAALAEWSPPDAFYAALTTITALQ